LTVAELVEKLPLTVAAGTGSLDGQVTGGYVSDLLSNVMGFASAGNVWVTMQSHQNIVAVGGLAGLAAVIISGGVQPEAETLAKAEAEGLPILTTELSSFAVVGQLYQLGISAK
jgi:predicted transcriptional regulator